MLHWICGKKLTGYEAEGMPLVALTVRQQVQLLHPHKALVWYIAMLPNTTEGIKPAEERAAVAARSRPGSAPPPPPRKKKKRSGRRR